MLKKQVNGIKIFWFNQSFKGDNYRILSIGNSAVPLTIEEGDVDTACSQVYPVFYSENIENIFEILKGKSVHDSDMQHDDVNAFFDLYDLDGNRLQVCSRE